MVYTCPTCNQDVQEDDKFNHELTHVMGNITGVFAHSETHRLALSLTELAVSADKPVKEVIDVYRDVVRALMESGLFKG